ncbi:MAG TPA: TetR/AcrR family transcriptional regulator [Caulobacteraceae bacterium]|nr:TetR/AcrR family transcriptional regulator [Caulobacteraceae bacterium]
MPRAAGQIDRVKNEAILDAASDLIFERGLAAPLDEVARRAGVSKQTIYNHYGSKGDLIRALLERRSRTISAPLALEGAEANPEATLAAYAENLLRTIAMDRGVALFRLLIASAGQEPGLAHAILPRGFGGAREKLTVFLEHEAAAGRLAIPDAAEAAEFFAGMVTGARQLESLLGLPQNLTAQRIDRISREAARRFVRAYAP